MTAHWLNLSSLSSSPHLLLSLPLLLHHITNHVCGTSSRCHLTLQSQLTSVADSRSVLQVLSYVLGLLCRAFLALIPRPHHHSLPGPYCSELLSDL